MFELYNQCCHKCAYVFEVDHLIATPRVTVGGNHPNEGKVKQKTTLYSEWREKAL